MKKYARSLGMNVFITTHYSNVARFAKDECLDRSVLSVIRTPHRRRKARKQTVVRWLENYNVVAYLTGAQRRRVATNLLTYADGNWPRKLTSRAAIMQEFERLKQILQRGLNLSKKIESLTSKALWCCYPSFVPILDANAERSLRIISRQFGFTVRAGGSRYAKFVEAWQELYAGLKTDVYLGGIDCRYKVRFVDRFLWWLGQKSFEDAPGY